MTLIGVAWASEDVETDAVGDVQSETSVAGSVEASSSTSLDDDSTSTTIDEDDEDRRDDHSTTSTTLDDDDARQGVIPDPGIHSYVVSGVGNVTIEIVGSGLRLVAVNSPGWTVDIEMDESDKIEIEFRRGGQEAEFEAEIHSNGGLSVEIDGD